MDDASLINEFQESFPAEWARLKKLYFQLKLRRFLIIVSIAFILLAIALYFSAFDYSFELSLIPGILGIGAFYFAYFQLKNPIYNYAEISALSIPLLIHLNTWNIEYEYKAKPHLREFQASRLYPFSLSNLNGKHFFSGIAKKLPFIAWFVEAEYIDKVGESPLSMISSRSVFNGYTGIQIMVKNLVPHLNGIVVVEKGEDEDLIRLDQYYKSNAKWKPLSSDDIGLKRQYNFYTPIENPQNILDQLVLNKVAKIKSASSKPISLSIRRKHVYLNQYWNTDYASFNLKKDLSDNIISLNRSLKELIELSFILAMPS
ncbi:hypothetical protein HZR84_07835 [Hyphobacterium sp. CCMP332]|nr:hypothetical protein HZR84_07835 [Hyphobacterium sp. CCMP332]